MNTFNLKESRRKKKTVRPQACSKRSVTEEGRKKADKLLPQGTKLPPCCSHDFSGWKVRQLTDKLPPPAHRGRIPLQAATVGLGVPVRENQFGTGSEKIGGLPTRANWAASGNALSSRASIPSSWRHLNDL